MSCAKFRVIRNVPQGKVITEVNLCCVLEKLVIRYNIQVSFKCGYIIDRGYQPPAKFC